MKFFVTLGPGQKVAFALREDEDQPKYLPSLIRSFRW